RSLRRGQRNLRMGTLGNFALRSGADRQDAPLHRPDRGRPSQSIRLLPVAAAVFLAPPLLAQHQGHGGGESVGWVPREILERPVGLRRDIENLHEKVTTASADAQAFYDQGLNYLSSYVWIEAVR